MFQLDPMGTTVKLTLLHYDIEAKCRKGIAGGWPAFFSRLKTLLETGKAMKLPKRE